MRHPFVTAAFLTLLAAAIVTVGVIHDRAGPPHEPALKTVDTAASNAFDDRWEAGEKAYSLKIAELAARKYPDAPVRVELNLADKTFRLVATEDVWYNEALPDPMYCQRSWLTLTGVRDGKEESYDQATRLAMMSSAAVPNLSPKPVPLRLGKAGPITEWRPLHTLGYWLNNPEVKPAWTKARIDVAMLVGEGRERKVAHSEWFTLP